MSLALLLQLSVGQNVAASYLSHHNQFCFSFKLNYSTCHWLFIYLVESLSLYLSGFFLGMVSWYLWLVYYKQNVRRFDFLFVHAVNYLQILPVYVKNDIVVLKFWVRVNDCCFFYTKWAIQNIIFIYVLIYVIGTNNWIQ